MAGSSRDTDADVANGSPVAATIERLAALCLELLPVDGASVLVRSSLDHRELLYASDPVITRLDDLQFVTGEGPCIDAYRDRFPVFETDLSGADAATRWPGFAREANRAGAMAVFAFPLQVGAVPFGIVELYRSRPGGLEPVEVATALVVVDDVARVVLQDLSTAELTPEAGRPTPVFGRPEIPQATGMIAVQLEVSIPAALAQLRAAAFAQDRAVQAVAEDVLAGRLTFEPSCQRRD